MKRHRTSIRLKGWDYSEPGAYFGTICARARAPLFGRVVDGEMVLNAYGEIVREEWFKTAQVCPYVELFADEFVVTPNHIHGIIWIVDAGVGARRRRAPTVEQFGKPVPGFIPTIIRAFKSAVTRRINARRGTPGARVWQRNYDEPIIRNPVRVHGRAPLHAIRRYIAENPLRWHLDRYNPDATGPDPRGRPAGSPLPWRMLQTDARACPRDGRGAAPLRPYDPAPPKPWDDQEARP